MDQASVVKGSRNPSPWHRPFLGLWSVALLVIVGGCAASDSGRSGSTGSVTVFEGARLITGAPTAPIEDAVFVVEGGRFVRVGTRADVEVPSGAQRVDLSGKTVMPGVVNAHIHLSSDREERNAQLRHMAYYGASAVISLGLDSGDVALETKGQAPAGGALALTAGRGITAPEPGRSEIPHWVTTETEARAAVQQLAAQEVDFVKIWVDDRGGRYEKLSPALYGAVINEAHAHGLRVTAHVFTLEDAKGLLRAGIDAFAHGVRDQDVDDELVELWQGRPDVTLVPNLPGPGVPVDLEWINTVTSEQLAAMQESSVDNPEAQRGFGIQARNLARLHEAGVRIAFGTDGSAPWNVHLEMEDMVRAGLSPAEVITAATLNAADLLGLDHLGSVAEGKSADFIVLNANPLEDIRNSREIEAVYLRGDPLDRAGLAAQLVAQP